jgi:hypothetical protein
MIKRTFYNLSSLATFIINIKHVSFSQWDVEETEYTQSAHAIRQQR